MWIDDPAIGMAGQFACGFLTPKISVQQSKQFLAQLTLDFDINLGLVASSSRAIFPVPLLDQQFAHRLSKRYDVVQNFR
ncbi:hypothetical protein D9M68_943830 [compost metagenome]